jgi:hypothetical protein
VRARARPILLFTRLIAAIKLNPRLQQTRHCLCGAGAAPPADGRYVWSAEGHGGGGCDSVVGRGVCGLLRVLRRPRHELLGGAWSPSLPSAEDEEDSSGRAGERELWRSPTLLVNGRYQTGVNIRSIKATGTSMHALTQRYAPHLMHGDCTQVHHCTPTIPALYGCLQPVIGVTLSIALLGESFDARDVGSVLLIIGGLVVVTMKGLQLRGTPSATGLDSFAGFHPELPHRHLARK